MEIGFETIGNATLIVHDRRPLLVTDPWIQGSAYFGSWKLSNEVPEEQAAAARAAEYVWFSHGHPDHLNGDSLPALAGRKVLLPDHVGGRIRDDLQRAGFNVRIMPDRQWVELSPRVHALSIADYNQDAILLVDINGRLVVNLNDASDRGWGWFVRRTIAMYRESFLLALHGFGDADMFNFFDESGRRIPLPPMAQLGRGIATLCHHYGARHFVPFSSMHRYQRTDSAWAAPYAAGLDDFARGFESDRVDILPAFIRYDCLGDTFQRIDPAPTADVLLPPETFGDDWGEPLEPEEARRAEAYFRRVAHLDRALDFLTFRIGEREHTVRFERRSRPARGLTIEAPRASFMAAIDYEIFDDLLIGNFAKVTLHGPWPERPLYPDITPYIAKYGDNGKARSRGEVARYFAAYRRRDPAGHARHWLETRLVLPVQRRSASALRRLGAESPLYRSAKKTYWALRRAL